MSVFVVAPYSLLFYILFLCCVVKPGFRARKSSASASRLHASRPEATPMDFTIRPQSKIDPDEVRARARLVQQDERRMKVGGLWNYRQEIQFIFSLNLYRPYGFGCLYVNLY